MAPPPGRPPVSWRARLVKAAHIALMATLILSSAWAFGATLIDCGDVIRHGLASRDWPGKVGTVETSFVEKGGRGSRTPRIGYRYEVDGRTMRSERIGTTTAYENAYDVVAAFPVGAEVLVYHDATGDIAVLERGVGANDFVRFAVVLLTGAAVLFVTGTLLHMMVVMPAIEHLAQWSVVHPVGYRAPRTPEERERQLRADLAMEAEIAERLREQAARRQRKHTDRAP